MTFAVLLLVGCYEDKGNYDYHELDVVDIDTLDAGIQSEYSIMRFDELTLDPKIYYNGTLVTDDSNAPLDYLWTIYSATSGAGASTVIDTLSTERRLSAVISRTGGTYYVQLVVTNRNDGIRQFFRIPVAVSEVFDGGWMVFYERADAPGYSDLALIINPWTKLNVNYNRYYSNLYETTNGEPLRGQPIRCLDIAVSLGAGNNYIGLCTDYTLVGVNETGIAKALDFEDFFNEPPHTMRPTWYGEHGSGVVAGQSSEVLINNNDIYTNTYAYSATEGRTTKFGVPKFSLDAIGELAPWNAELAQTLNYGIVVYDQTYHRFRYSAYNSAQLETFGEQDLELAAFDVNNTGMTLVMADWGKGTSQMVNIRPYDYIIMAKGGERYLAVTNFSGSAPTDSVIGVGLYPMDELCPNIDKATSMASSHVGSFIYYSAGNTLYNFAYDSKLPATVAWTAPDGEEVTCVRIMKYYHGTIYGFGLVPRSDNLVHIATWNEETQEGHVYQYLINPASGILNTANSYDYTVPGKVKDMAWKFSMQ